MPDAIKLRDAIEYLQTFDPDLRLYTGYPDNRNPITDIRDYIRRVNGTHPTNGTYLLLAQLSVITIERVETTNDPSASLDILSRLLRKVESTFKKLDEDMSTAQVDVLIALKHEINNLKRNDPE